MADEQAQAYATQLTNLARQLNVFVASLKIQRKTASKQTNPLREIPVAYEIGTFINLSPHLSPCSMRMNLSGYKPSQIMIPEKCRENQIPITNYELRIINYQLSIINYPLSIVQG